MIQKQYYDRYSREKRGDNTVSPFIPFITLTPTSSWKQEYYRLGISRLDVLADKYYGDPNLGWLILLVNRDLFIGGEEFNPISEKVLIKIPFPKADALSSISKAKEDYIRYYGN
jgi:hypothetical protein